MINNNVKKMSVVIRPIDNQIRRHIGVYNKNCKKPIFFGYDTTRTTDTHICTSNDSKLIMVSKPDTNTSYEVVVWNLNEVITNKLKIKPKGLKKSLYGDYGKCRIWFKISKPLAPKEPIKFLKKVTNLKGNKIFTLQGDKWDFTNYGGYQKIKTSSIANTQLMKISKIDKFSTPIKTKIEKPNLKKIIEQVISKFNNYFKQEPKRFLNECEIQCELFRRLCERIVYNRDGVLVRKEEASLPGSRKIPDISFYNINNKLNNKLLCWIELKYCRDTDNISLLKNKVEGDRDKTSEGFGYILLYNNRRALKKMEIKKIEGLSLREKKVMICQCSYKKIEEIHFKYFR